jgi:hypothetical protein
MSITVSYNEPIDNENTGSIEIVDSSKKPPINVKVKTEDFYKIKDPEIYSNKKETEKNDNDDDFTMFQKIMRYLDMVKDAQVQPSIPTRFNFSSILYPKNKFNSNITGLLDVWKPSFIDKFEHMMQKYPWTKKTKTSTLSPMLSSRTIFKETGLDPAEFITPPDKKVVYVGNIANEVIDTGKRAEIKPPDIRIPDQGSIELILNENFLSLFGFEGCSLTSKKPRSDYEFEIKIESQLDKTNTLITIDDNNKTKWALGNKEKNKKIIKKLEEIEEKEKKTGLKDEITRLKDEITALFLTKELGDVLQVLIMFIWTKLNKLDPYSMVTCDKVVLLLCMVLQLNCILTSGEKNKNNDGVKLRCIEVFEPSGNSKEKATERFNETKSSILVENEKFIENLIKMKKEKPDIYVSSQPLEIPDKIYDKFIFELKKINEVLNGTKIPQTVKEEVSEIDKLTDSIKKNFTFKIFITSSKTGRLTLLYSKFAYTSDNTRWIQEINPSEGDYIYNKTTFYNLIINPDMLKPKSQRGGGKNKPYRYKSTNSLIKKSSIQPKRLIKKTTISKRDLIPSFSNFRKTKKKSFNNIREINEYPDLELPDENYEVLYYDKETETEYKNLYAVLIKQIQKYLHTIKKDDYFQDVYSELLHHFYLTNEVLYDDELTTLINNIIDSMDTVKETTISTPKNTSTNIRETSPPLTHVNEVNPNKNSLHISTPKNTSRKTNKRNLSPPLTPPVSLSEINFGISPQKNLPIKSRKRQKLTPSPL